MRKIAIIFLSVMVLTVSGCGNKKADVVVNTETKESVTETSQPESDKALKEESETEEVKETETETVAEDSSQTAPKQGNSESEQTESKAPEKTSQTADVQPEEQEEVKPEPEAPVKEPEQPEQPEQPQQAARVEYSPANVVSLATAKTKAAGKVLLTENLNNMLASGQISQEEYNEYYPYDGAGYYSVFVDSNLVEARDVSGTEHFNSEDDIARYIADMLTLENGPYFLIEYAGTYDYYGKQCYEFRCYRA